MKLDYGAPFTVQLWHSLHKIRVHTQFTVQLVEPSLPQTVNYGSEAIQS